LYEKNIVQNDFFDTGLLDIFDYSVLVFIKAFTSQSIL
jgi:hypothetical protein